ncbi:MAG: Hypothetical protein LKU_00835 [Lactobacillus kefiranofaciens]|uniref:LcnD-like C-terminal domain-containing protein n=2 Tax=Bacillota TaxID=1239 RepID=A0AAX3UGH4_9LACO|nr:hypothetical protein [Lactobacillus kefiranofaciens]KRL26456.1 hypothetical protein FC94_GL000780 [Lactobacillus kefiranofaciens subsp. kefirgranum DSM 10550 = JCM 8572]KRM19852.1 hypothetical protein FC93_GL002101 [Lactobacillus kefiranofaciens subsp. kefiranofaciens DSM 5016 = JCM 6985]MCJ2173041.1 hypothetical protein [Lactobacillus kefiranofaciens]URW71726.1 hypothetical protein MU859_02075 [Lactobacillus kefiranofaciens subsp. kefirgranum]URW73674.1 hypothetical protein MU860_02070 [La
MDYIFDTLAQNSNYYEGQIFNKGKTVTLNSGKKVKLRENREAHLSGNRIILFPSLNNQKSLKIVSYVPNDEISLLRKNQNTKFQMKNRHGETIIVDGKVKSVAIYPKEVAGKEGYLLVSNISPTKRQKVYLRYGMESQVSVVISRQTYFNFLKDEIFDKQ